jgi:DNA polymerase I-like protein with 3'-5' exonuclease and polymerase domains
MLEGVEPDEEPNIIVATTEREFTEATDGWRHFAFDIETPKGNTDIVHSIAVANEDTAVVVDLYFDGDLRWLRDLFQRDGKRIVQNGAFDMPILWRKGLHYDWRNTFDTMLAAHVLYPDERVGLAYLVAMSQDNFAWKHDDNTNVLHYNARDACYDYRVAKHQWKELKEKDQMGFCMDHIMPLLWEVIIPLHEVGIPIDDATRIALRDEQQRKIDKWRKSFGLHFKNLEQMGRSLSYPLGEKGGLSHKNAVNLLYARDQLSLPMRLDPETGRPSTKRDALKQLQQYDKKIRCSGCTEKLPLSGDPSPPKKVCEGTIAGLLERSELSKGVAVLNSLEPSQLGRVHTRYVLGGDEKHEDHNKGTKDVGKAGPRTGRLASRDPNLMNLTEDHRYAIKAGDGLWLVERDYSQIELRFNALSSRDENLLKAISEGDAHLYIAWLCDQVHGLWKIANFSWEECYGRFLDGDPLVKKARKSQKTPTYGWFYRMGEQKMVFHYDITRAVARDCIDGLNEIFPGVRLWWQRLVGKAGERGYLLNPFGRRRYFRDLRDQVPEICNFLPQSTAADVLFIAMRSFMGEADKLRAQGIFIQLLLPIHDALLVETEDPDLASGVLKRCMEFPIKQINNYVVPTDAKVGLRWGPKNDRFEDAMVDFDDHEGVKKYEENLVSPAGDVCL